MKFIRLLFILVFLVSAQVPTFEPPVPVLLSNGDSIKIAYNSSPYMADWNDDGLMDLVTGDAPTLAGCKLRVYLNEGTPSTPVFTDYTYIRADGSDIEHEMFFFWKRTSNGCNIRGCTVAIKPQVVDWNGDGKKDLLIGDGEGNVHYYQRLPDNTLTKMPSLQTQGDYFELSTPVITDWNNNGLLDLVLGTTWCGWWIGVIRVYLNAGTAIDPVLNDYSLLLCGSDTIAYTHIWPEVADLNTDGLNDLIVCQHGDSVIYFENSGTPANPVFNSIEFIDVTLPLYLDFNACVYDWDNNGAPDILLGDCMGNINLMMNKTPVNIMKKNPFAQSQVPKTTGVEIFDIKGRKIGSFDKQGNLPNGVYYIKVPTNNSSLIRKIVIAK